jgi:chromatin licensing and DNA replication factor 1
VGTNPQSTPSKIPAYQPLASPVLPASAALPLPYRYSHLAQIFQCVEAVVSMMYKRKEVITFRKLKPAVEEMLRRLVNQT